MKMSEEWTDYFQDNRKICKYGKKCYQKNPQHHTTYKHPPLDLKNNRGKRTANRFSPYSRQQKQKNNGTGGGPSEDTKETHESGEEEQSLESKGPEKESITAVSFSGVDNETPNKESSKDPVGDGIPDKESIKNLVTDGTLNKQNNKNDVADRTPNKESSKNYLNSGHQNIVSFYDQSTDHSIFKELFLVDMPVDFFNFYECLNDKDGFEETLSSVNLEAVGPYDLLLGKLPKVDDKESYLQHWRFFFDPPEFQTVLKRKGKSEYHIGYFRDDPNERPVFLASNDSAKDCLIKPMSDNIFGAFYVYLQNEKKASPFTAMICQKIMDKVKTYAEENNYSLEEFNIKKRLAAVVTKSFHNVGIVVPFNKKTQLGYRRLVESDANIKKLCAKLGAAKTDSEKDGILSEIQPVITYASIAVDECDFGTGIEVGIDLFCTGLKELEPPALSSLTAAYSLLNREAFSKIIQAHLKHRRRGPNMSILNLIEK